MRTYPDLNEVTKSLVKAGGVIGERAAFALHDPDQLVVRDANDQIIGYKFPHPETLRVFDSTETAVRKGYQPPSHNEHYMYPNCPVLSDKYLNLVHSVIQRMNKEVPPSDTDHGITDKRGITGSFSDAYHLSGVNARPAPIPLYDNEEFRRKEGLENKFPTEAHRNLFRAISGALLEEIDLVAYRIKYGKSTSSPYFTTDVWHKQDMFYEACMDYDAATALIKSGQFMEAHVQYGYYEAVSNVFRSQTNDKYIEEKKNSKDRPTWSLKFVQGIDYSLGVMDKKGPAKEALISASLNFDDTILSRFTGSRLRTANGTPQKPSVPLAVFFNGLLKAMMRRFPFTYHDTGIESKMDLINKSDVVAYFDVGSHDLLWPELALDTMVEDLKYFGFNDIAYHFEATFRAPRYAPSIDEDNSGILIGSFDKLNGCAGMPSGSFATTPCGCWWMTYEYIQALITTCVPNLWSKFETVDLDTQIPLIHEILSGHFIFMLKLKSDDCVCGATSHAAPPLRKAVEAEIKEEGSAELSTTMKLTFEPGGKYLGDIQCRTETSNFMQKDVRVILIRILTDEYSCLSWRDLTDPNLERRMENLDRSRKKFCGIGAQERIRLIKENQYEGSHVISILNEEWKKSYGIGYEEYVQILVEQDYINLDLYIDFLVKKREKDGFVAQKVKEVSPEEAIYLMDDSKIYSTIREEDISDEVKKIAAAPSIPVDDPDLISLYHKLVPEPKRGVVHGE